MSKKSIEFEFEGIDFWSRPVFRMMDSDVRIGSTNILFPNKEIAPNGTKEDICEYFRKNPETDNKCTQLHMRKETYAKV